MFLRISAKKKSNGSWQTRRPGKRNEKKKEKTSPTRARRHWRKEKPWKAIRVHAILVYRWTTFSRLVNAPRQLDVREKERRMLEGGRSIFQLALNKYPHAFQRPVTPGNIHVCSYVRSWAPTKERGSAVRRCTRCGTAEWGEGGNNSFVGGIRTAKEEDVEDEEREGANGLEPELTNAKELSGISHLISRATRLRWYASRRGRARRSEA